MSADNDHFIAQFCSITGCSDSSEASHFLLASNNDIDVAISLFMDSSPPSQLQHHKEVEELKEPHPPQRETLLPTPQSSLFQGRLRSVEQQQQQQKSTTDLPSIFKPPTEIIWKGTFEDAKREATSSYKYILLTFHRPNEFSCQRTIRDIWRDPLIMEFLKDNLLFHFVDESEGDSSGYLQFYGIESLPHWSLIDPRTGRRVRQWNGRATITSSEVLQEIAEFIFENPLMVDEDECFITKAIEYPLLEKEEEESPLDGSTVTIGFRLPDGKRIKRKFRETNTVGQMFTFVKGETEAEFVDLRGRSCTSYKDKWNEQIGDNLDDLRNSLLTVITT